MALRCRARVLGGNWAKRLQRAMKAQAVRRWRFFIYVLALNLANAAKHERGGGLKTSRPFIGKAMILIEEVTAPCHRLIVARPGGLMRDHVITSSRGRSCCPCFRSCSCCRRRPRL